MFVSLSLGYLTRYVFLVPPTLGGLFKNNKESTKWVVGSWEGCGCRLEGVRGSNGVNMKTMQDVKFSNKNIFKILLYI